MALMGSGFVLTGCSVVRAVSKVAHDVEGNRATIDAFTNKMGSSGAIPFEATYVTTGSSPATIVYAVQPPKGLAFTDTPSASSAGKSGQINTFDLIVNGQGEFACTPPPSGGRIPWQCQKLSGANEAAENNIYDFYTPSHWVTFLKDFSLAAGFAGDQVELVEHDAQRVQYVVCRLRGFRSARKEHHLHDFPGHTRLRQGCIGVDQLRDQELFVDAVRVAVPVTAWREGDSPAHNHHLGEPVSYLAPRMSTPGRAPVSFPWSRVTSPRLIVAT